MNNLAQKRKETNKPNVTDLKSKLLTLYRNADSNEREAIIKHIDSFVKLPSKQNKPFWLKLKNKLLEQ